MTAYISTLKNKTFSLLFLSIVLSNLANSIANISLIWIAYNRFNSPLVIALVLGALQLPALILGPLCGGLLDKFKKTNLMILANIVNACVFLFLMINPLKSNLDLIVFLSLLVVSGAMKPLLMGGDSMIIQDVFPDSKERIPANALTTMSFDLTYIFGSLLSGVVIALGYGFKVYSLVAVLYFLVAVCIWRVSHHLTTKYVTSEKNNYTNFIGNLKKAFLTIFKNTELTFVLLMDFIWNMLLWAGLTVLLPIVVKNVFSSGSVQYGLVESMTSIGIVIGSFLVGQFTLKNSGLVIGVVGAIGLHGLLFIMLGLTSNLSIFAVTLLLIGIIVSPALIYKVTFYQKTFDESARGALFTISGTMTSASYPIGIALTSFLASYVHNNVGSIFVVYGIITVIVALIVFTLMYNQKVRSKKLNQGDR